MAIPTCKCISVALARVGNSQLSKCVFQLRSGSQLDSRCNHVANSLFFQAHDKVTPMSPPHHYLNLPPNANAM